ncbi:MAG TPA: helix-turn-helix transcriptional regulator [Candidatus Limnocylindrales bacterium]|nr:helix-turn-helix transcriptional regulator [Candidatus Limnocylindrales bacterium]
MVETQTPGGKGDPATSPSQPASRAFHQWLKAQLKATNLTQRQLARKSGVDHSTISRLIRGDRVPSLRTATLLARGLGMPEDVGRLAGEGLGERGSPAARVEYALRSDDLLGEAAVREIMNVYLAARLRRRSVATPAPVRTTSRTPVPIVIEVGLRPRRSPSIGRPNVVRGRAS